VVLTLVRFEGGPMDGRTREYDVEGEELFFDDRTMGPAAFYRRSDRVEPTPGGAAAVYVYVGPSVIH
jgi:hypothetical protein